MYDAALFTPVAPEKAKEVLNGSSQQGLYRIMMEGLSNSFGEWFGDGEGKNRTDFVIPVTGEGTVFGDKNTDTVYQGIVKALKLEAFKGEYRCIKRETKNDKGEVTLTEIFVAKL